MRLKAVITGNLGVGLAFTVLSATQAEKALAAGMEAWDFYFHQEVPEDNFRPDSSCFFNE